ncbi:hypothetical protein GCM10018791_31090 [Streptomyces zaomyceticus]|nr:hypothetical protein GCM10018791_31090 [Streptomyces zaomyceticus]
METTAPTVTGKAVHEPATEQRKATTPWMSVTDVIITARTAAVRTGSGIRRRARSSSTHNCRDDRASCSIVLSLPTTNDSRSVCPS